MFTHLPANVSKSFTVFATLMLVFLPAGGFANDVPQGTTPDIVDTAVSAGTFETLVAAVKAAGLVETLKGDGPFTVFAPNDEAFAKLPAGTVEGLLADPEKLASILTYHVVAGKKAAADVVAATSLDTVQGSSLTVDTTDGVKVGAASVLATDVMASNGVIHVIDTVLIPGS